MSGTNTSGRKGKTRKAKPKAEGAWTAECPEWMPDEGAEYWARVVPLLTSRGVLDDLDEMSVQRLCQLYAEWARCRDVINEEGVVCRHTSDRGAVNTKAHPVLAIKNHIENELGKLSNKLGLTPKDRETIKAHKNKTTRSIRDQYDV